MVTSIIMDNVMKYTNNDRNVDLYVDERPKGNAILHPNFNSIAPFGSPQPMNLNGKDYGKKKHKGMYVTLIFTHYTPMSRSIDDITRFDQSQSILLISKTYEIPYISIYFEIIELVLNRFFFVKETKILIGFGIKDKMKTY